MAKSNQIQKPSQKREEEPIERGITGYCAYETTGFTNKLKATIPSKQVYGGANKRLLAVLFLLALGSVAVGIGLLGFPIVTICYSLALLGLGGWGCTTKRGKSFTLRILGEKQRTCNCSHNSTYSNKPNSTIFDRTNKRDTQSTIENNEPAKKKGQYCDTKDKRPKTLHTTPPRGES